MASGDRPSSSFRSRAPQGSNKPLTDRVYEYVYSSIVNARLTSNDLLTETALAGELGLSKAPVREALITLCDEKILQCIPRMGYRVLQISPQQLIRLGEARLVLETALLEKSWPDISDAQAESLRSLLEKQISEIPEHPEIYDRWQGNILFHMTLAGFHDNEYLLEALRRILRDCARGATQCFLGYRRAAQEAHYHERIVEALLSRSYEAARDALIGDIRELM